MTKQSRGAKQERGFCDNGGLHGRCLDGLNLSGFGISCRSESFSNNYMEQNYCFG